jgi:hypothetical protein
MLIGRSKYVHICVTCEQSPREMYYVREMTSHVFRYYCSIHVPARKRGMAIIECDNRPMTVIDPTLMPPKSAVVR